MTGSNNALRRIGTLLISTLRIHRSRTLENVVLWPHASTYLSTRLVPNTPCTKSVYTLTDSVYHPASVSINIICKALVRR